MQNSYFPSRTDNGGKMKSYKYFLIQICKIENVTVKDIMKLTGKSQSVVYSWLNPSMLECFPTIESLGKILFRLGLSFDDFINLRHPIYGNGESTRIYYQYIDVRAHRSYIRSDILDLPNAEDAIKTYIFDRTTLNKMIEDYINDLDVDVYRFDLLCKALMPIVITGDGESIFSLSSQTLSSYKLELDCYKEAIEDYGDNAEEMSDILMPEICFPDANYVVLLAAEKNISLLKEYLSVIDEKDKCLIEECYAEICSEISNFDKKNKILKLLVENKCEFSNKKYKESDENYCALMKKLIKL